jgi:tetratricopeptide (TPR) repeat protein
LLYDRIPQFNLRLFSDRVFLLVGTFNTGAQTGDGDVNFRAPNGGDPSVGSQDLDAVWWAYAKNPVKAERDYEGRRFSETVQFQSALSIPSGGYRVFFNTSAPNKAVTCFLAYAKAQKTVSDWNVGQRIFLEGSVSGTFLHDINLRKCRFSSPPTASPPPASPAAAQTTSAYVRGLAALSRGDVDAAISEFTASIADDPKDPFAYIRRATAYEQKGNKAAAIADYRSVLKFVSDETYTDINARIRRLEKTKN